MRITVMLHCTLHLRGPFGTDYGATVFASIYIYLHLFNGSKVIEMTEYNWQGWPTIATPCQEPSPRKSLIPISRW